MSGEVIVAYLAAGVLFIRALGGLSKQETAQRGNSDGVVGMALAILVATTSWAMRNGIVARDGATHSIHLAWGPTGALVGAVLAASVIGASLARRVEMTGMPELVAVLHSFVGLAAVLVGVSSYLAPHGVQLAQPSEHMVHLIEVWVGSAVGAITLTGSIVAWAKLRGTLNGKPLLLPGRHLLNAGLALAIVGLAVPFVHAPGSEGLSYLLAMVALAAVLGTHLVLAIGGADMPVVVSLLNSYSGWAAAAAGFMLSNDLLIVTGALVGSSGRTSWRAWRSPGTRRRCSSRCAPRGACAPPRRPSSRAPRRRPRAPRPPCPRWCRSRRTPRSGSSGSSRGT